MSKEMDRAHRIETILLAVNNAKAKGVKVNKEKLIAVMSIDFNAARRTCLEYINTLILAGRITNEDFE